MDKVWVVRYTPDSVDVEITVCTTERAAWRQAIEYVASDLTNIVQDDADLALSLAAWINMGEYAKAVTAWNEYCDGSGYYLDVEACDLVDETPRPYLDLHRLQHQVRG